MKTDKRKTWRVCAEDLTAEPRTGLPVLGDKEVGCWLTRAIPLPVEREDPACVRVTRHRDGSVSLRFALGHEDVTDKGFRRVASVTGRFGRDDGEVVSFQLRVYCGRRMPALGLEGAVPERE